MTNEEAIDYLRNSLGKGPGIHELAVNIAVEAIQKQIPKKPTDKEILSLDFGQQELYGTCPSCGKEVYFSEDVCHECYQRLDWSDQSEGDKIWVPVSGSEVEE